MDKKVSVGIIAVIVVIVAITAGILGTKWNSVNKTNITQTPAAQQPAQVQSQANNDQSGPASIKEIVMHAGIDLNKIKAQDSSYFLSFSSGHYLLLVVPTHTLIYDGATVYNQADLLNAKLSYNGLHYVFDTGKEDASLTVNPAKIYVDGRQISSDNNVWLMGISDDGNDYYYTVSQKPGEANGLIYKRNGQVIEKPTENFLASISSKINGTSSSGNSPCPGELHMSKESVFNPDGQSAHICSSTTPQKDGTYLDSLIINGKALIQSPNLGQLQFTSQGHYAILSPNENRAYIDGQAVNGANLSVYINEDASHKLIIGSTSTLDNKPVTIKDGLAGVDMNGNNVYLYYLAK